MFKLLTVSSDAKTPKGQKLGYLTGILYLAPATESGIANLCPKSTPGCRASCLYTAGRFDIFPVIAQGRIRKTRYLMTKRSEFLTDLRSDIRALIRKSDRLGLIPCVRLNGTSDLPWLALKMAKEFPSVQFYDYTKIPRPWERTLPNYHLTFSLSESNRLEALEALSHGINVAVVFSTPKGSQLPTLWNGFPVLDGDTTDLRFLDSVQGTGPFVIGLRAKGRAKRDRTGFVQSSGFVPLSALGNPTVLPSLSLA